MKIYRINVKVNNGEEETFIQSGNDMESVTKKVADFYILNLNEVLETLDVTAEEVYFDGNNYIPKYTLADIVKTSRLERNLTKRELARLLGVSHTTIIDIENEAIKETSIPILIKLSKYLDIDFEVLLRLSGYSNEIINFLYSLSNEVSDLDD